TYAWHLHDLIQFGDHRGHVEKLPSPDGRTAHKSRPRSPPGSMRSRRAPIGPTLTNTPLPWQLLRDKPVSRERGSMLLTWAVRLPGRRAISVEAGRRGAALGRYSPVHHRPVA